MEVTINGQTFSFYDYPYVGLTNPWKHECKCKFGKPEIKSNGGNCQYADTGYIKGQSAKDGQELERARAAINAAVSEFKFTGLDAAATAIVDWANTNYEKWSEHQVWTYRMAAASTPRKWGCCKGQSTREGWASNADTSMNDFYDFTEAWKDIRANIQVAQDAFQDDQISEAETNEIVATANQRIADVNLKIAQSESLITKLTGANMVVKIGVAAAVLLAGFLLYRAFKSKS
jgi:hypothetical protein